MFTSNNTYLSYPKQFTREPKFKICNECNRKREFLNGSDNICHICYKTKKVFIPSGNKVIDDFIIYTLTNNDGINTINGKMEFVPYESFKDVKFIAEGGFSKIYKATWIDGPISYWDEKNQEFSRLGKTTVALKELNNSKNINPNELNELRVFHNYAINSNYMNNINKYYGITQHPDTQNFMIIMKYYKLGDLSHYIAEEFLNIRWSKKLNILKHIITGLKTIHEANLIHKDYHSGNIFISHDHVAITGDLGLSKSSLDDDDDNEIYGIIPNVAPEIFHGQKYTKDSDIYGFGMIMWELMTGRRPFWNKNHDIDLIIEICEGLRPPIITNSPKGYIELMQECWHSNPKKRPKAAKIYEKVINIWENEIENIKKKDPTKVTKSPDVGPITAIYKSRSLSAMIKSAQYIKSQSIILGIGKRKFNNDLIEDETNKKITNQNNDYLTKELEFDLNFSKPNNHDIDYITKEIDFDIEKVEKN